jgi:hypothetical protein
MKKGIPASPGSLKSNRINGLKNRPILAARPVEITSDDIIRNGKSEGITAFIHKLKEDVMAKETSAGYRSMPKSTDAISVYVANVKGLILRFTILPPKSFLGTRYERFEYLIQD